jgi:hypothetical protein
MEDMRQEQMVSPKTFADISCITPRRQYSYSNAWILWHIDQIDNFFMHCPLTMIGERINAASINIFAVGIERVMVAEKQYAMMFVQGRLKGSEFTHTGILRELSKITNMLPHHYTLGDISRCYPSSDIESITSNKVEHRVKGGSRLQIEESELLQIPTAALSHAQAKMTVAVVQKQLETQRELADSTVERLEKELTTLRAAVKSGSGGRVLAEFFYNILKKRDAQTQLLVADRHHLLIDGSIPPHSTLTQAERLIAHCETDANWWVKAKYVDSDELLQGELKDLFVKAWQYRLVSPVWRHGGILSPVRHDQVLACNDYSIKQEYWSTRQDFAWPADLQYECHSDGYDSDDDGDSRTRKNYILSLEANNKFAAETAMNTL